MPIYEPGLDVLVAANVRAVRFFFTTDLAAGVKAPMPCSSRWERPPGAATGMPT